MAMLTVPGMMVKMPETKLIIILLKVNWVTTILRQLATGTTEVLSCSQACKGKMRLGQPTNHHA